LPVVVLVAVGLFFIGKHNSGDDSSASRSSSANPTVPAKSYPPVDVSPVPRTATADKLCPQFLAALPNTMEKQGRRRVNAQDQYFLAWGAPPVIVQCGVPRPSGFKVGTSTIDITPPNPKDGTVRWFQTPTTDQTGLWTAVDRPVYITVTVPDGGDTTGDLQTVGAAILKTLPATPVKPGS
jgi:hypothetical protein